MKMVVRRTAIALIVLLPTLAVAFYLMRAPKTDLNWESSVARTPSARIDGTSVTVTNVRNWRYDIKTIVDETWIDEVCFDTRNIIRLWFILEPFAQWDAVGHTFLSFEFENGEVYSFSVEARREEGETYSPFKGLFRKYELYYAWGTERDFISRRLYYLKHSIHIYELNVTREQSADVLSYLCQATADLYDNPRFYNTLNANCTNMLAKIINKNIKDAIPYDISWNLPGYSDKFLQEIGYIDGTKTIDALRSSSNLAQYMEALTPYLDGPPQEFSKALRELLKKS